MAVLITGICGLFHKNACQYLTLDDVAEGIFTSQERLFYFSLLEDVRRRFQSKQKQRSMFTNELLVISKWD